MEVTSRCEQNQLNQARCDDAIPIGCEGTTDHSTDRPNNEVGRLTEGHPQYGTSLVECSIEELRKLMKN